MDLTAIIAELKQTNTAPAPAPSRARTRTRTNSNPANPEPEPTNPEPTVEPTTDPFAGFWLCPGLELHLALAKSGANVPTLLVGEPGSGKTDYATRLAETLGMPLVRVACGAVIEATDLLAIRSVKDGTTGWELTPLGAYLAQETPAVVLLDELTRLPAGAGNVLLPLLDGQGEVTVGGQKFAVPSGTVWVATGNPPRADDRDVRGIGSALSNRLAVIELEYPPEDAEVEILTSRGVPKPIATKVVRFAGLTRNSAGCTSVSTRQAISIAKIATAVAKAGRNPSEAILLVAGQWPDKQVGGRLSERQEALRLWQGVF